MRIKYFNSGLSVIVVGFLLFGIQAQPTAQQVDPGNFGQGQPNTANNKKNGQKAKYAPGRFIVKFKSEGPNALTDDAQFLLESHKGFQGAVSDGSDSLDKLNQKHKVKNARGLFVERNGLTTADAMQKQNNSRQFSKAMHQSRSQRAPKDAIIPDLSNVYILEVPLENDIEGVVSDYQSDPHVEYAQPDYIMEINMAPNDPYYSSYGSWGQTYDDLWGLKKIQAGQAWDTTQGEGVVVAVVDTGLDYNHPDIAANVWTNLGETPNNGIDDDGNGKVDDVRGWDFANSDNDPMDGYGHGTHVSGTIAAVGNNGIGIIGVAPKVKIMPVKGFSDTGSGSTSALSNGIVYAAQNGADVINNSWGCSSACPSNPIAEDAVRTAYNLGAVVVFAAGNQAVDVSNYSPQNMTSPKPIVVSATTTQDILASFSNFGALVDVAAPGNNILSIRAVNTAIGSTSLVGTEYRRMSGTSMAASHATGVSALVLAYRPTFSNEGVRQVLRGSADAGRLNAVNALSASAAVSGPELDATFLTCPMAMLDIGSGLLGTFPPVPPGQIVHLTCPQGYSGMPTRMCDIGFFMGYWQPFWGPLSNPCLPSSPCIGPDGTIILSGSSKTYYQSSSVPYPGTCVSEQRICNNGILSGSYQSPSCIVEQPLSCPTMTLDIGAGLIGMFSASPSGTTRTLSCPIGYAGTPARTCDFGTWGPLSNGCVPLSCGATPVFLDAIVGPGGSNQGDMRTVSCDARYTGSPTTITCNSGTWIGSGPTCAPIMCPPMTMDIGFGLMGTFPPTNHGQTSTLNCSALDNRYQGVAHASCEFGSWTNVVPGCTLSNCPDTSLDIGSGLIGTFPASPGGTTRTLSCPIGYSGTPARTCDFGTWGPLSNGCVPLSCGATPVFLDAIVGPGGSNQGDMRTVSCDARYTGSPTTITCNSGTWIGPGPSCVLNNPDLLMTAVSGPSTAVTGTSVTVSNTVKNQGTGKTGSFSVGFYLSTDAVITTADTRIATRYIGSLAAGAVNSVSTTLTVPTGRAAGTYYLGAIADYANTVMESNETNNALTGNAVTLTSGVDLVMTAVSGGSSSAFRGTSVIINNAIQNQGVGKVTNTSSIGLYLSIDPVITTADRRVGTRTISSLAAGIISTASTTVTIPSTMTVGIYYIGAIGDYTNTVKENNETNNARAGNTLVVR